MTSSLAPLYRNGRHVPHGPALYVRLRFPERDSRSIQWRTKVVGRIELRYRLGPASCRYEALSSGVTTCLAWR